MMLEKGERREVRKKEKQRGGERKERVNIIWIGFRKDGHRNFTLKLCRQAVYFYVVYSRRNMEEFGFGEIFLFTYLLFKINFFGV